VAAIVLAIFRHRFNGINPTIVYLLLVSLVLEAIKLAAAGASFSLAPSDWTQVTQFVACKAIYSFMHALSLPVLFVSVLLSLQSRSPYDLPHIWKRDEGDRRQYAVDTLLIALRLLLGLIRSSIFTATIHAIDIDVVPQTGVSPELGSLDLLAITLVIFDVLLVIDISLQTWWLGQKSGRSNKYSRIVIVAVVPLLWLHTINEILGNSSIWIRMWEEVSIETTTWSCIFRIGLSASFALALYSTRDVNSSQSQRIRLPEMPSDQDEEE